MVLAAWLLFGFDHSLHRSMILLSMMEESSKKWNKPVFEEFLNHTRYTRHLRKQILVLNPCMPYMSCMVNCLKKGWSKPIMTLRALMIRSTERKRVRRNESSICSNTVWFTKNKHALVN